jgi:uncharacterized protein DUF4397
VKSMLQRDFVLSPSNGVLLMRLTRLTTLFVAAIAIAGCSSDKITSTSFPPLAGVRWINAVPDTGAIDVRAIDQIEFSPVVNALAYTKGTEHQPIEAKARHFRAFITSTNPAITSNPIVDTTITFAANQRYTVLITGAARSKVSFVVIDDNPAGAPAGQIGIRTVNASTGAIDSYVVDSTNTPVAAPATAANVAPNTASPYVGHAAAKVAVRVTPAGTPGTVSASQQGPYPPATLPSEAPAAGVTTASTPFSVYYFAAGVPGSPTAPTTGANRCGVPAPGVQAATCVPQVIWFVDNVPTPTP